MSSIVQFLQAHREADRDYCVQGEVRMSYAEAFAGVRENSLLLRAEGADLQNIALLAGSSLQYVMGYWSVLDACSTVVPLNPSLTVRELQSEIDYTDCNWMVFAEMHRTAAERLADMCGVGLLHIQRDWRVSVERRPWRRARRENGPEVAVMLHTSGTTGDPKKVMLSHSNLVANTKAHTESLDLRNTDVGLVVLPMFFGYCNTAQLLTHTLLGGTIVVYDQPVFTAKRFCQLVERHRIRTSTLVPTMLSLLAEYRYLGDYDLSSMRYICFGGGPASTELLSVLYKALPDVGFVQTYGQTECSPRVTALLPQWSRSRIGSVGRPIPDVAVEVVDNLGQVVAPGCIGEFRVRGPGVMCGYYRKPEETSRAIRDGWLYTGDLGRIDSDGFIYLAGRRRNVVISGGTNIYPEEIEVVLLDHPQVREVLVRGESDPIMGERVVAEIVVREQKPLSLADVNRFLSGKLARYKWPTEVILREALRKTASGKICR